MLDLTVRELFNFNLFGQVVVVTLLSLSGVCTWKFFNNMKRWRGINNGVLDFLSDENDLLKGRYAVQAGQIKAMIGKMAKLEREIESLRQAKED